MSDAFESQIGSLYIYLGPTADAITGLALLTGENEPLEQAMEALIQDESERKYVIKVKQYEGETFPPGTRGNKKPSVVAKHLADVCFDCFPHGFRFRV